MFTKALVAVDLSPASEVIVGCVNSLRLFGTQEFIVFHCYNIPEVVPFSEEIKEDAVKKMLPLKNSLESQGGQVTLRVEPGFPQIGISRVAEEEQCSLIVVGSHGHSLGRDVVLGSISGSVINSALSPVLIFHLRLGDDKQPMCAGNNCDLLEHVLYCTDFSDNAEHAFGYVEQIVRSGAQKVTLLHVQDQTKISPHLEHRLDEFDEIDRKRLVRLQNNLNDAGAAKIDIEIKHGVPKAEILNFAKQVRTSLLILGSHGRGYVAELFIGSVSHSVARHADFPVLLIPMPREDR